MDSERIIDVRNRVFESSIGVGKDIPYALKTDNLHIYRRTGFNQIADIINTGYVRPKEKVNGGHKREVFWSLGGEKLFYYDKSPILETSINNLTDNMVGALHLNALTAIYVFSESLGQYVNVLEEIKEKYQERNAIKDESVNVKR